VTDEFNRGAHDPEELTPAERAAFAALSREAAPGRLLEERTVRSLRGRGLVHPAGARAGVPRAWVAAAMAAGIALFACGVTLGQWVQARQTAREIAALRQQDDARAAALVRQTGAAYVSALSALARTTADEHGGRADSARAAATQVLRAAAGEVLRVAPDDPVAAGILAAYDRSRQPHSLPGDTTAKQRVVWF
jgi:hypothetical protein